MRASHLVTAVRHRPGVAIVDLCGDVDGFGEEALEAAYAKAEELNTPAILLNFAAVDYINSKGIALIVGLLARARRSKRQVLACGLTGHFLEIFEITRLSDFIQIYADEEAALASARSLTRMSTVGVRSPRPI
jgi:anti-sigma B factor antagonist